MLSYILQDTEQLKATIRHKICNITKNILHGEKDSFREGLQQCIKSNCAQLTHTIFKN